VGTVLIICRDGEPEDRVRLVDVGEQWGNVKLTCYVAPKSRSQGLATEAGGLAVGYGFDHLPIREITARDFTFGASLYRSLYEPPLSLLCRLQIRLWGSRRAALSHAVEATQQDHEAPDRRHVRVELVRK